MISTNGPRLPMPILLYVGRHAHQCGIGQAITLAECTLLCTILAFSFCVWYLCVLMWLVQMAMDLVLLCVDRYMHMHMHLPLLAYMCLHTRLYIHIYTYIYIMAILRCAPAVCVLRLIYTAPVWMRACCYTCTHMHTCIHTYIHTYIYR